MKPILLLLALTLSCHAESPLGRYNTNGVFEWNKGYETLAIAPPERPKELNEAYQKWFQSQFGEHGSPQVEVWTNANPPKAAFGTSRMRAEGSFHWVTNRIVAPTNNLSIFGILNVITNFPPRYPITYQTKYPAQVTVELVTNVWSYDNAKQEREYGGPSGTFYVQGLAASTLEYRERLKRIEGSQTERWDVTDTVERTTIVFHIEAHGDHEVRDDKILTRSTNHFVLKSEWTKQ